MTNKFEFFEENGMKLYGQRFGRAIQYSISQNSVGMMEVEFAPGIILADDEQREPSLISKETFVCNAIQELANIHKTVYVKFKVYGETLKVIKGDSIKAIEAQIQRIKEQYIKKLDIY